MSGFVYCFSNPAMPGLVKIGYTETTIEQRLGEANASTWIPAPFIPEFAKYVRDPVGKEQTLHKIFNANRVSARREFFRVEPEAVRLTFELMDGAWWNGQEETGDAEERILGEEILRMFLDTHVHPTSNASLPVQWTEIAVAFQTWKRKHGYKHGATMKLREMLTEAYGQPTRGSWSTFRLETPSDEYCDDDRAYIRPSAK